MMISEETTEMERAKNFSNSSTAFSVNPTPTFTERINKNEKIKTKEIRIRENILRVFLSESDIDRLSQST